MADKTKTIKNATDKELNDLILRLQKERELQELVRSIKTRSEPDDYGSYTDTKISTEAPIDSMYHHGILGMKWGVRRTQSQLSRAGTSKGAKKSVKDMSDDELKKKVARLNLEKNYAQLTAKQKSKGQRILGEILENYGKQLAGAFLSETLTPQLKKFWSSAATGNTNSTANTSEPKNTNTKSNSKTNSNSSSNSSPYSYTPSRVTNLALPSADPKKKKKNLALPSGRG